MGSALLNQLRVISAIYLHSALLGIFVGYFAFKETEYIYTGTIVDVGTLVGMTSSAILLKYLGRRKIYAIYVLPNIIAWTIVLITYELKPTAKFLDIDVNAFLCTIFLATLSLGGNATLTPIIIGELCNPKHRGILIVGYGLTMSIGLLIAFLLIFFRVNQVYIAGIVLYILVLPMVCTWPESPMWLAYKKRFEKCEEAFYCLRERSEESNHELEEIMNPYKTFDSKPKSNLSGWRKYLKYLLRFTARDFLEPLQIMLAANVLLHISGKGFGWTIMQPIIYKVVDMHYVIITQVGDILTTILAIIMVKYMKRRTMILSSGAVSLFTLILLFISLCLPQNSYPFLVVTLVVIFFLISSTGCTQLSVILAGEVFPLAHKGVGSATTAILSYGFKTIIVKSLAAFDAVNTDSFPVSVRTCYVFMYILVFAVCLTVLYKRLPETKDKTLQEIEIYFRKLNFKQTADNSEGIELQANNIE